MRGTVKFFSLSKGFGFIIRDDGATDVYFNRASLRRDRDYDPVEGDLVEFEVRDARLGPLAHHVEQIQPADGTRLPIHANGKGTHA